MEHRHGIRRIRTHKKQTYYYIENRSPDSGETVPLSVVRANEKTPLTAIFIYFKKNG